MSRPKIFKAIDVAWFAPGRANRGSPRPNPCSLLATFQRLSLQRKLERGRGQRHVVGRADPLHLADSVQRVRTSSAGRCGRLPESWVATSSAIRLHPADANWPWAPFRSLVRAGATAPRPRVLARAPVRPEINPWLKRSSRIEDASSPSISPTLALETPFFRWTSTDAICGLEADLFSYRTHLPFDSKVATLPVIYTAILQSERDCRAIASLVSRRRGGNVIICKLNDPCG